MRNVEWCPHIGFKFEKINPDETAKIINTEKKPFKPYNSFKGAGTRDHIVQFEGGSGDWLG